MIIGIGNGEAADEGALWAEFPPSWIFPSKACFIRLPPGAGGGLLLSASSGFRWLLSCRASRGAFVPLAPDAATRVGLGGGDALPIRAMTFLSLSQNDGIENTGQAAVPAGRRLARSAFHQHQ
jgi:hypothetical protein